MSAPTGAKDAITMIAMVGAAESYKPTEEFSFEGPEKRLEVIMCSTRLTHPEGLRALEDGTWETVVASLNAKIVSKIRNDVIQSYVLTESSLFVTSNRIILITCGTTTLLNAVPHILDAISSVRGEPEWVSFMHKNYSFPWEQRGPHQSMQDECRALKSFFPSGRPFLFGPVDGDHYFFFCFDDIVRPCLEADTQMSMTMYGLDKDLRKHFFAEKFFATGPETARVRQQSRLCEIVEREGWELHDLQFEPCGYSVNAIRDAEYQTMHITPEDHCSFASYETNSRMTNLADRMKTVLSVFKPARFTVMVIIDPESPIGLAFRNGEKIGVEPDFHEDYSCINRTSNEFGPGYFSTKFNYVRSVAS